MHCILIESPEALNLIAEGHIKSIISLLDKHGRNHKVGMEKKNPDGDWLYLSFPFLPLSNHCVLGGVCWLLSFLALIKKKNETNKQTKPWEIEFWKTLPCLRTHCKPVTLDLGWSPFISTTFPSLDHIISPQHTADCVRRWAGVHARPAAGSAPILGSRRIVRKQLTPSHIEKVYKHQIKIV